MVPVKFEFWIAHAGRAVKILQLFLSGLFIDFFREFMHSLLLASAHLMDEIKALVHRHPDKLSVRHQLASSLFPSY